MKKIRFVRLAALCLCAALPLAGCGGEEASSASSAAVVPPASSSVAAADPVLPDQTEGEAPFDEDGENGLLGPLSSPEEPLSSCLSWGPGTAGSSLKSVQAAVALLNWAEENSLSRRDDDSVARGFTGWYEELEANEQENFSAVWPIIQAQADALISGEGEMEPLLEDAGIDPASLPDYTAADWEVLRDIITARVPLGGEA